MSCPIIIINNPIGKNDLEIFINNPFEELIKFTIDIKLKIIALGGEMYADSEEKLIENGSNQNDIWGANLYPFREKAALEYISLINIRPIKNNKGMEIKDELIRNSIKNIVTDQIKLNYDF